MAEGYTPPKDWIGRVSGAVGDAKKIIEAANRKRADEAKLPTSRILGTKDLASGQWDAARTLQTTLNGELRDITRDDLAAFKKNIKTVRSRFSPGISARQIINLSTQIDRDRANQQIKMAVPVSANKGVVRFITSAGGETPGVHRHHVSVDFLDFDREAAAGDLVGRKSAIRLRKSPLKIECDCGRWRFWYKYIATIGGYNAGKAETGYPKIRNPKLGGLACKHLLRVCHEIESGGAIISFLASHLEKGKKDDLNRANSKTAQKEAEKIAKNQNLRTKSHEIKVKQVKEKLKQKIEKMPKPKKPTLKSQQKQQKNRADPNAAIRDAMRLSGYSDAQIEAIIKTLPKPEST
ncbi:MAG: hypothetical protein ACR2HF_13885 [Methylococcaceae bacterium]